MEISFDVKQPHAVNGKIVWRNDPFIVKVPESLVCFTVIAFNYHYISFVSGGKN